MEAAGTLLQWMVRNPNCELAYFVFLRLFPVLCLRQLRRGGRKGRDPAKQVIRRVQLFLDFQWDALATEMTSELKRRRRRRRAVGPTKLERTLAKATALAKDGYLSRASSALEGMDPAPASEAVFEILQGLHPPNLQEHDQGLHAEAMDCEGIKLGEDAIAQAAMKSSKAAAAYLQPLHLRVIATDTANCKRLAVICTRILAGAIPRRAQPLVYDHRLFALNKTSKHQDDLERRVREALQGDGGSSSSMKLRPVAIGDALLRLAERAACIELKNTLAAHLMPFQVGVAVPGGLSMWATTAEAMLQADPENVLLAIDLVNCFNACDRDELIRECLRHEQLRPLARYVAATYPAGTIAWAKVEEDWRAIEMRAGLAQGRPLSPALASILLQPCLTAARDAMARHAGWEPEGEEARQHQAACAYLDDAGLVAHLGAAIAGYHAFEAAAKARGWAVNPSKTVLGVNLYKGDTEALRALSEEQSELIRTSLPPAVKVDTNGLVMLGTPCGAERGEWTTQAPVPVGNRPYREAKLLEYLNEHDLRLRRVVSLARRDSRAFDDNVKYCRSLGQLLLRWSCNARDVHLLRGLGRRLVGEAARRHDQGIKVAFACIVGVQAMPDTGYLADVPDTALSDSFHLSYEQASLALRDGGQGLRPWQQHSDAAFLGQWALTLQSADDVQNERCFYPVLQDVLSQAVAENDAYTCNLAQDLHAAWGRQVASAAALVAATAGDDTNANEADVGWLVATDGNLANLALMPAKAQRHFSATVLAHQRRDFMAHAQDATRDGYDAKRYINWLAECNKTAARAWASVPWQSADMLAFLNSRYDAALARRLRLPRPAAARAAKECDCGHNAGVRGMDEMGDHDEGTCNKQSWQRTVVHDKWVDRFGMFLKAVGMRNIRFEVLDWDGPSPATGWRRVPDIICDSPGGTERFIIDARIAWNITTAGGVNYKRTGDLARRGAKTKWRRWKKAVADHRDFTEGATFVPFSMECAGAWCAEANQFWERCMAWAGSRRAVDLYHWSAPSFEDFWRQSLGVCLLAGRGDVAMAAASRRRRGDRSWRRRAEGETDPPQCESSLSDCPI
jgi:hypothetical protein